MQILSSAILTIGMVSAAGLVRAQTFDPDYPVCMHVVDWGGGYEDCRYLTLASAQCRLPAARPSATSTRITSAQRRRDDETGGTVPPIKLIQRSDLRRPQAIPGTATDPNKPWLTPRAGSRWRGTGWENLALD